MTIPTAGGLAPSALPSAPVRQNTVMVDGARLRVLSAGSGPVLLYLHGVGDLAPGGTWLPALNRLAARHHVLRPDHPGFNASDDLPVHSPAGIAEVYSRLLDTLKVPSAVVVGCSFGGWVAVELALREPERVNRLVLIDPAGMPAPQSAPRILDLDPTDAAALTFADPALQDIARLRAAQLQQTDPVAARYERRNRQTALRVAGQPYLHDPQLPVRAAALTQPVTLVWGEQDRIVPLSHAEAWTAAVPHAELIVIPGAGHLPHAERPDLFFELTELEGS